MPTVIRAFGPIYLPPHQQASGYVQSYDPDAGDGGHITGDVELSNDLAKAKRFPNKNDAISFAFQTSKKRPKRADGKPNRPLLAFTLEFLAVDS